jgi:dTDP-4-dehydrorhamnose 3,5-epimerase
VIEIKETAIPEVKIISTRRFGDERGFFTETYHRQRFTEAGIALDFVQDNHSRSQKAGTTRGLHFQSEPFAQAKLVRVVRGSISDVAVDIRRSSPSYGRHVTVELSAENGLQLLVPVGFAHGFCTLEADTEVVYKVTTYYSAEHDHGIAFDDPDLAITWPVAAAEMTLSEKDRHHGRFADLPAYFE